MDPFNETNDYEDEEDYLKSAYAEPKKVINKFQQANSEYQKAIQYGLDGDNLLRNYVERGELYGNQALKIKQAHQGNNMNHGNNFEHFNNNKKESKPFEIKKDFKPIKIQSLDNFKPLEFVCKRLKFVKGNLVGVIAAGGSGKSLFLQHLAVCVASGKKLFGSFDIEAGKVLHIDQEQSERLTSVRYSRIAKGAGVETIKNIDRMILPRIDINANLDEIEAQLIEVFKDYAVVLVDSLKKLSNADENTAEIEPIVNMLRHAAEKSGTLVMLIHHMGKGKKDARQSGRGHSSIYDSVDMQIDLQHEATDTTGTVELECVKNREGAVFNGLVFRFKDEGEKHVGQDCSESLVFELLKDDVSPTEKKVDLKVKMLNILKDGERNLSSLFDDVGGDRTLYTKSLEAAVEAKLISERKGAKNSRIFSITSEGQTYLAYNDESKINEK